MMKNIGPVNALYPSLTTILGAHVEGRPNFLAVAHLGILNHGQPQYLSFGLSKTHFTNRGIKENGQFSVNIPSQEQVVETDYVGLVSGNKTDKSKVFELYYGDLKEAPLIASCPLAMECLLHEVLDYDTHEIFVGRIAATHAREDVLKDGKIDLTAVRPLLFDMSSVAYFSLGERVAGAWNAGKAMKKK